MKKLQKVKIIRNYNSINEEIQEDITANIQTDVSFFDLEVDIQIGDYVIVPNFDYPLIVENIGIYDSLPPGHKEVILKKQSKNQMKRIGSKETLNQSFFPKTESSENVIISNINAVMYLNALENAIKKSNIPRNEIEEAVQKIHELKEYPNISNINANFLLEVKQIYFD